MTSQEYYEATTGEKALYHTAYCAYHTLRYVLWLESRLEERDELFASRLGQNLPVIPLEDQLNILCDILRQIKATDRNVTVSFDGDNHIVKMIYGNHKKDTP